jgi:drug/metabolite transporter (DMT)-like permease
MKLLGILMLVCGVLALTYGGFSYMKTSRVIDAGPVTLSSHWRENVPLPPIVGAGFLIGGAVLLAISSGRSRYA